MKNLENRNKIRFFRQTKEGYLTVGMDHVKLLIYMKGKIYYWFFKSSSPWFKRSSSVWNLKEIKKELEIGNLEEVREEESVFFLIDFFDSPWR